jgi:predicted transcriptional regulator
MDFFDKQILTALSDGSHSGFADLLGQVCFSHNTLQKHLTRLVAEGFVIKQKDPKSNFGRPKYTPIAAQNLQNQLKFTC